MSNVTGVSKQCCLIKNIVIGECTSTFLASSVTVVDSWTNIAIYITVVHAATTDPTVHWQSTRARIDAHFPWRKIWTTSRKPWSKSCTQCLRDPLVRSVLCPLPPRLFCTAPRASWRGRPRLRVVSQLQLLRTEAPLTASALFTPDHQGEISRRTQADTPKYEGDQLTQLKCPFSRLELRLH